MTYDSSVLQSNSVLSFFSPNIFNGFDFFDITSSVMLNFS